MFTASLLMWRHCAVVSVKNVQRECGRVPAGPARGRQPAFHRPRVAAAASGKQSWTGGHVKHPAQRASRAETAILTQTCLKTASACADSRVGLATAGASRSRWAHQGPNAAASLMSHELQTPARQHCFTHSGWLKLRLIQGFKSHVHCSALTPHSTLQLPSPQDLKQGRFGDFQKR